MVVVAPVALACATLDIPAAADAPAPGMAAPLGVPHVWLDAAEFGDTDQTTGETFWVVQRNGLLKVISLGLGAGASWVAEEGWQASAGCRIRLARTHPRNHPPNAR